MSTIEQKLAASIAKIKSSTQAATKAKTPYKARNHATQSPEAAAPVVAAAVVVLVPPPVIVPVVAVIKPIAKPVVRSIYLESERVWPD